MHDILRIAKISAKKNFQELRKKSPIFCPLLKKEIKITKLFLSHIAYVGEKRTHKEIVERILIIPFIEEIATTGDLDEVRENQSGTSYQISKKIQSEIFSIIIIKTEKSVLLLSCFRNWTQKKDLS